MASGFFGLVNMSEFGPGAVLVTLIVAGLITAAILAFRKPK